jgi:antitoxin component YwqK of YwqJK toxin-antitoxin module
MNRIAILLCVSLMVFTGCSGKKMRKDVDNSTGDSSANRYKESEVYWHGDLVLLKSNNLPLTGFLKRFDDKKGYLSEESYYVNGLKNGWSKSFREDGSSYNYNYVNGELNGVHKSFNKDGALIDESYYKDGELNGMYKSFDKDGALIYESYYKDGEQSSSSSWYDNGIKSSESNYKNGKVNGKSINWYETGKLKSVSNYEEGKRIGWQSEYTESGEVLYEVNLINGNGKISYKLPETDITINEEYLNGKEVSPENGKDITINRFRRFGGGKIIEKTFENGQLNGVYTHRNLQSKKITHETNYKNGLKHGKDKSWYNNGQLSEEGQYENDLKHGVWQEWYENGKLKTLRTYNYGKKVSKKCWDESGKSIKCD